jgi:uncharacterized membrane protein
MTICNTEQSLSDRTLISLPRKPIHPILGSFSAAYFTGALATDIAYWRTADVIWETFSDWLLVAGMIMASLAIMVFWIDLVVTKQTRTSTWPSAIAYGLAVLLSFVNAFVHSRDGYTAVVPAGLILSALVVVILLISTVMGRVVFRPRQVGERT